MNAPAFKQRGAAMMEVLIAMLIVSFGVLGFVGLQAQTTLSQVEAYQRSQALILLNDITQRIQLNRTNAADYVGADIGVVDPGDCTLQGTLAGRDLCEWSLLIQGAAETQDGAKLGAMAGARGCIISPAPNQYLVSLAWQGVQPSGAPPTACGQGAYSSEAVRRVVTSVVQIATLGT